MQRNFVFNDLAEAHTSHNPKLSLISLLVFASPSCIHLDGQWLSQSSFTTVEVAYVCVSMQVCACTWIQSISILPIWVTVLLMVLLVAHSWHRLIWIWWSLYCFSTPTGRDICCKSYLFCNASLFDYLPDKQHGWIQIASAALTS